MSRPRPERGPSRKEKEHGSPATGIRLQKALSGAGVASRRAAEDLIAAGRITVNGRLARLGGRVDPANDDVRVDGRRVVLSPSLRYMIMNKPAGFLTTVKDPGGRSTVMDLIGEEPGVYPVGRLDMATRGLLMLTNDGELAFRLTHPSYGVPKIYVAEVRGPAGKPALAALAAGVDIGEDRPAAAASISVKARRPSGRPGALIELTVREGRKHVVRRMLESAGFQVVDLVRIGFGPLRLGKLAEGTYRMLTAGEISSLYRAVEL